MISSEIVIVVTVFYLLSLFVIAYFVEKKFKNGINLSDNALVYALSLGIYCTAWTFYGNVGLAATSSYLFIGVYIGPTIFFLFWQSVIKRLIRIRETYGITSIADFISTRYGKSQLVAAIVSLIALVGIVPYLALQLKAILTSYNLVTTGSTVSSSVIHSVDPLLLVAIIIFVIMFGLRSLDQAERHPGMVMVVAIQSVIKIVAFISVGYFATYVLNNGFGDIFTHLASNAELMLSQKDSIPSYSLFMAYTVLSFSAIIFLPRQFHMIVVENNQEKHLRTAMWVAPLYFIIITIFVIPIAMAGLLQGYDKSVADSFILLLPLKNNASWLSLGVFLGGLSAAFSMLMVSSMTITIMISNFLILPLLEKVKGMGFLMKYLLFFRWLVAAGVIFLAYLFEVKIGSSYVLVKIGMISFAAVLQFAPASIGGLFWDKGNRLGAILGLISGFAVWFYTCLLPAILKSGWLNDSILQNGPFNIGFLRPEKLFGITALDPLALTVLLSLIINTGFYIVGSLMSTPSEREDKATADFFAAMLKYQRFGGENMQQESVIVVEEKTKIIKEILSKYLTGDDIEKNTNACIEAAGIAGKEKISINELILLNNSVEKILARYVGTPAANEALRRDSLFDENETASLSDMYAKMAVNLKLTPLEFNEKIDYFVERDSLLNSQQKELEKLVKMRTNELEEKMVELEQWQKATIDRELKMIEIKEELESLKQKTK